MNMFYTIDKTNNVLNNHRTESNEQHKYSRLSSSSYFNNNKEKQKELLNMPEHQKFKIDDELSNNNHTVFL